MVYKVDKNPQLDSRDWNMYSNILKIDLLRLCSVVNNHTAVHIAIIFTISLVGRSPYRIDRFIHSLIDYQPPINKLMVLNDPRRLSAIFLNGSVRYYFEKP